MGAHRNESVPPWLKLREFKPVSAPSRLHDRMLDPRRGFRTKGYFVLGCGYLMFGDVQRRLFCSLYHGNEVFFLPPFRLGYMRTLNNKLEVDHSIY